MGDTRNKSDCSLKHPGSLIGWNPAASPVEDIDYISLVYAGMADFSIEPIAAEPDILS